MWKTNTNFKKAVPLLAVKKMDAGKPGDSVKQKLQPSSADSTKQTQKNTGSRFVYIYFLKILIMKAAYTRWKVGP